MDIICGWRCIVIIMMACLLVYDILENSSLNHNLESTPEKVALHELRLALDTEDIPTRINKLERLLEFCYGYNLTLIVGAVDYHIQKLK